MMLLAYNAGWQHRSFEDLRAIQNTEFTVVVLPLPLFGILLSLSLSHTAYFYS